MRESVIRCILKALLISRERKALPLLKRIVWILAIYYCCYIDTCCQANRAKNMKFCIFFWVLWSILSTKCV